MIAPTLNAHDRAVLEQLVEAVNADGFEFYCLNFAGLMRRTGLDRKTVRKACRKLARKGLAEFQKGLWTDCGEPAGAGYGATRAGIALIRKLETAELAEAVAS